jgi:hypothetical protein
MKASRAGWILVLACGLAQYTSGALVSYWDFDEAASGTGTAFDQQDSNDGTFVGAATRTTGLIGTGAALFSDGAGEGVTVGSGTGNNLSFTTGITVEALIRSAWSGNQGDYDEIFRKDDDPNRILLCFQNDTNWAWTYPFAGYFPDYGPHPVLSFGLDIGGVYSELDMPLDGAAGRPTVADLTDGATHHIVGTYDSTSGTKALYVDGTLRFSIGLIPGSTIVSGGGATATIGNWYPGMGETFDGVIDELAIYDEALPAPTIATHWSNVLQGWDYFTVPEPASLTLFGAALAAAFCRRRRAVA